MFDEIRSSFQKFPRRLSGIDQKFVDQLPSDYLEFLRAHNGGFVDKFRYTFLTGVPFKTEQVDNPSRDDCPVEFFGIGTGRKGDRLPGDLIQIAAEHAEEEFLPNSVIAIALWSRSHRVSQSGFAYARISEPRSRERAEEKSRNRHPELMKIV